MRKVTAATRLSGGPSLRSNGAERAASCSARISRSPHDGGLTTVDAVVDSATLAASAATSSRRLAAELPHPPLSQHCSLRGQTATVTRHYAARMPVPATVSEACSWCVRSASTTRHVL